MTINLGSLYLVKPGLSIRFSLKTFLYIFNLYGPARFPALSSFHPSLPTGSDPDSVIEEIITTAAFAPSAHNRQPWRFTIPTEAARKSGLADAMALEYRRDLQNDDFPDDGFGLGWRNHVHKSFPSP